MKVADRTEARKLRLEQGLGIREIATRLSVAPSSVSRWTRDIELTDRQWARLRSGNRLVDTQRAGAEGMRRAAREKRREAQSHGRRLARRNDPLHISGCMLFWAEGSKCRGTVAFTNADVSMMMVFLSFLTRCYSVTDQKIGLALNCHLGQGLPLEGIEKHWLGALALPDSCLRTHTLNQPSKASLRKRRTLPYGTARLVVCSTFITQSIYGAIQEYSGVDRPEWLD